METKERKYRYSEIFGNTIQGEGEFTGVPTVWVRWWGCNFECKGFGQKDPTDPSTYVLPFQTFDISKITKMEDLPVWHTGCDSSYSWSKKFSHLAKTETADQIADKLMNLMKNKYNPGGLFLHPYSGQDTHLAFTGGEPLMSQHSCLATLMALDARNNPPLNLTFETNGTQKIRKDLAEYLISRNEEKADFSNTPIRTFWSCSPKLSASGEAWDDAIMPDVLREYSEVSNYGQLKYVVDGSDRCWHEVEQATDLYRAAGIDWPVWIMPVGADVEMQEEKAADIAHAAIERGYSVAARVHVHLFGNKIGT